MTFSKNCSQGVPRWFRWQIFGWLWLPCWSSWSWSTSGCHYHSSEHLWFHELPPKLHPRDPQMVQMANFRPVVAPMLIRMKLVILRMSVIWQGTTLDWCISSPGTRICQNSSSKNLKTNNILRVFCLHIFKTKEARCSENLKTNNISACGQFKIL